jgi:hypothetical protein
VEVHVHGVRQDVPPKMESIRYEILVDTDESDRKRGISLPITHNSLVYFCQFC